ncbi:RHOMBOID-like protein 1 isoform X2 [Punica granatum]|uniref:RHOMBOID-like protein n=1 Tax=Punica granatum TaxID=22663 RepID=A0A6P8DQF4_PUNGR|nr:RHOMBOID-like protein 1 isoform X2 [Punica granatum]
MAGDVPSSSSGEIQQVRTSSWRIHSNNIIHPVDIDTPPPSAVATPSPTPVVYREVKHFKKWAPWLVPCFVAANTTVFVITMYVNACPKNSVHCIAKFLGRLSFQPFKENPLLGPSSSTLLKMGALDVSKVVDRRQVWLLITCIWLHGGLLHLLANMLSLLIIGIGLEQEFGFVRIGMLYIISGLGGSLMSALFIQSNISVGASGALFGLLGGMLSELITNWTIYSNKVATSVTLLVVIAINLAVGILPHVDNFAHIGGFLSGFFLGFIILIRPQYSWITQKYTPPGFTSSTARPKFKMYQRTLWVVSLIVLVTGYFMPILCTFVLYLQLPYCCVYRTSNHGFGFETCICLIHDRFTLGLIMLLRGVNANNYCSWCHYLSCVPTSRWSCKTSPSFCITSQSGNQFNLTCSDSGKSHVYTLRGATNSQIEGLCSEVCS